jgi:hypothetical protein
MERRQCDQGAGTKAIAGNRIIKGICPVETRAMDELLKHCSEQGGRDRYAVSSFSLWSCSLITFPYLSVT